MRIGTFAKKNNLNTETIRYYMELGLVVPVKKGGHYDFSGNCQRSLDQVLTFKSMGFTLQEIRSILHFSALSRLHSQEEKAHYKGYFTENLSRIEREIKRLQSARQLVIETLNAIEDNGPEIRTVIGIPISVLAILQCPKCGGDLMLKDGKVMENKIIDGTLGCGCGMNYSISDGILEVDPLFIDMEFSAEKDMRVEYFESTSQDYIEKVFIAGRWMENVMEDFDTPCVVLEPGVGSGYALGQGLNSIPEGSTYFAVDHNMNRLREIRNYFSKGLLKFDLVLIASDFLSIPLKEKTVDVIMDMSGSSNRAFDSSDFLLTDINALFKDHAKLFGLFIMAEGMDPKAIPPENHALFTKETVKECIEDLGFRFLAEFETSKVTEGGPHESFVDCLKATWTYCFYANR